ncbi:MAG: ThiF family adenylyltransferase [Planctomycetota bacterium]|nr:ThiF family adenylyltransferase [Planctomycetota bacterium]
MTSDQTLIIDDDDRYGRMRLIAWWDQEKLRNARVLVVGIGALGNEVAKNLVLMGVGDVVGIDLDCVEDSNLTRSVLFRQPDNGKPKVDAAARALLDMNADTRFHPIHGNVMTDIGLGLVRDVDVVIGCLDNREARLWVNRMCWKTGTPWVDGGIQEINGVAKVFVPPDGACYECAMTENDYRLMNIRYSCPLLKREDILEGKVPTAPTISSIIAGLQTQEALKLIHGMEVEDGGAMVFNGIANNFYKTSYQHRPDCLSHDFYGEPVESGLSQQSLLKELFEFARQRIGEKGLTIRLDRDLVESIDCPACDSREEVLLPTSLVSADRLVCADCGASRKPVLTHQIPSDSVLSGKRVADVGIPLYDIVRIQTDEREIFVELDGDRSVAWGSPYRESDPSTPTGRGG